MKNKNLKGKKRGGCYWKKINGEEKPFGSVTSIISIIDKPALRYWFGKEVYYAMVKDPSLSEKTALASPYVSNEKAKKRGTTVHSIVEAYKFGNKVEDIDIQKEYLGYAKAFYKFVEDMNPVFREQEKTVFSEKNHYAGTLDVVLTLGTGDYVIDIKTGKNIYLEAFIQGSAYKNVLDEEARLDENGKELAGVGVLLLKENGDYELKTTSETKELFEVFKACKTVWEFLNKKTLDKIGYFN